MPETQTHASGAIVQPERPWFLTYHAVLPRRTAYLYDVSTDKFEEHLALSSLCGRCGEMAPVFTFDDGHLSNYTHAFPLLEKHGVRGTFFLVGGFLGVGTNYMTWRQAREMAAAGHRLQSHGWSHRLLTTCKPKQLDEELMRSKRELEDRLGIAVDSLSMPGGRWDMRVLEQAARAGYQFVFHSNPWAARARVDGLYLQGRLMVTGQMTRSNLQTLMNSSPAQKAFFQVRYRVKEGIRAAMGDKLYHRLWCWKANFTPSSGMEVSVNGRASSAGFEHHEKEDAGT